MHTETHQIQAELFKALLLRESARFSELKPKAVPSDQFTFHLKKLIEDGIVAKRDDGSYELTIMGKEYANRFDTDSGPVKFEKQAKLGVLVVATRRSSRRMTASRDAYPTPGVSLTPGVRETEFVMQERRKHPFFGFRGFVTGKIKLGESVIESAERELEEETGLKGEITHHMTYHERIYATDGTLLEDKYFFLCRAHNPKGELLTEIEGGRNAWVKEGDVPKGNVFYDIPDLMKLIHQTKVTFAEKSYTVEKY